MRRLKLLAKQWVLLVEMISGGDSEIKAAAIKAWKDHRNWPLDAQDALLVRYGLSAGGDREASMQRMEKVAKFIGQAIGRKYYRALEETRLAPIIHLSDPALLNDGSTLFRDVEASLAEDPAGEKAQALVVRWTELKGDTEGGSSSCRSWMIFDSLAAEVATDLCRSNQPSRRLYRIEQVSSFLARRWRVVRMREIRTEGTAVKPCPEKTGGLSRDARPTLRR